MPRPDIEFSQNLDLLMQQVLQTRPSAPFLSTIPITLSTGQQVVGLWVRLRPTWVHFNGQMHPPNGRPTLSVTVAGTVDGSADPNPAPGPWVAFATAEPFHVTVNYELHWDGHQQTNDLVAEPPSASSSDGRGPPFDPLPRSRTDGRRFTIVHPAVEFEDGPPGVRIVAAWFSAVSRRAFQTGDEVGEVVDVVLRLLGLLLGAKPRSLQLLVDARVVVEPVGSVSRSVAERRSWSGSVKFLVSES